ncbi:MAG: DUF1501 domain-containing protein [Planctomycetia bacterium]|nr:DUF1501 domain-containing protein [Planctomycetia bacterium]
MRRLAMSGMTIPGWEFLNRLQAHAGEIRKRQKACILLWMSGGPPTIDLWDLKPESKNGGEFRPISTRGDLQICEHLPRTADVMQHLSVVRTMSTREADHARGRYYMHTANVPNPAIEHPTFGSVVSLELGAKRPELELPAFVSIGGSTEGPGYVGMSHSAFQVEFDGQIKDALQPENLGDQRLLQRRLMLDAIETEFINTRRGQLPRDHRDVYRRAMNLMTSRQRQAFQVGEESQETIELYSGTGRWARNPFSMGCLMARRLVEAGVPFVEVVSPPGSWDLHERGFATLKDFYLPVLDQVIFGLTTDLERRGLLQDTTIVCMGEFGRTPRINQNAGRDHWATAWSVLIGGGGLRSGIAVGETDKDGTSCLGTTYQPGDIWATVSHALGIPVDTVHTTKNGRPMKIANGGTPVKQLIG